MFGVTGSKSNQPDLLHYVSDVKPELRMTRPKSAIKSRNSSSPTKKRPSSAGAALRRAPYNADLDEATSTSNTGPEDHSTPGMPLKSN